MTDGDDKNDKVLGNFSKRLKDWREGRSHDVFGEIAREGTAADITDKARAVQAELKVMEALRELGKLVIAIFGGIPTAKLSALLTTIIDGTGLSYQDMPKALVLAIEDARVRIHGKRCEELRQAARRLRERQLAAEDEAAMIEAALLLIVQPQSTQFVFPPPVGGGAWLTDLKPLAALALLRDVIEVPDTLVTFAPPPEPALGRDGDDGNKGPP